jgi:hypothetical protein
VSSTAIPDQSGFGRGVLRFRHPSGQDGERALQLRRRHLDREVFCAALRLPTAEDHRLIRAHGLAQPHLLRGIHKQHAAVIRPAGESVFRPWPALRAKLALIDERRRAKRKKLPRLPVTTKKQADRQKLGF